MCQKLLHWNKRNQNAKLRESSIALHSIGSIALTLDASSGLSPELQQIADRAYFLRGKFIGAYAQIEFVLADVCSRFWERPAYQQLKGQFPFQAAGRVEEVTKLFKADGPLAEYWKDVEPLLAQLTSFRENRHLFAHGHLMLTNSNSVPSVHFRLYVRRNDGVELHKEGWTLEHMESIASDIAAYAGRFGRLLDRIYAEQGLN